MKGLLSSLFFFLLSSFSFFFFSSSSNFFSFSLRLLLLLTSSLPPFCPNCLLFFLSFPSSFSLPPFIFASSLDHHIKFYLFFLSMSVFTSKFPCYFVFMSQLHLYRTFLSPLLFPLSLLFFCLPRHPLNRILLYSTCFCFFSLFLLHLLSLTFPSITFLRYIVISSPKILFLLLFSLCQQLRLVFMQLSPCLYYLFLDLLCLLQLLSLTCPIIVFFPCIILSTLTSSFFISFLYVNIYV